MIEFSYVALDSQGVRQRGTLAATDAQQATQQLAERQLQALSLTPAIARRKRDRPREASKGTQSLALLVSELATLLEAGVPLAEATATLADAHGEGHPLKTVLRSIRGGRAFSDALAESELTVPVFVLQLVRAGEATGRLAAALQAAAVHLEAEQQFTQDARNALLYPMVLIGSGILATLVMFVFVVPRFATVLENPKADLPWVSQVVLGLGMWLTQHQVTAFLSVALLTLGAVLAFRRPGVRLVAWETAGHLPIIGDWVMHSEVGRWASLFGVLLSSRVPLLTALAQANETLRTRPLKAQAVAALGGVRGGKSLSQALGETVLLDAAGLNLIRVGERAGSLSQTVGSLARMHTNQSQLQLKRFLVLLEPVAILVISIVLGGIMISVMLAITSLTNVL